MQNYTIREIEALTEEQAAELSTEKTEIKGHSVYFGNLGECFGFSVMVFMDGKHIHYANDYQLHHSTMNEEELRQYYIDRLNDKLFTDQELLDNITSYDEYQRKNYFLQNYYPMRYESVSCFFIVTPESEKAFEEKTKDMIFNPVSYSYMNDREAVKRMITLSAAIHEKWDELEKSYDYIKDAFLKELFNHEYIYNNYQGNYDVLSCFGNIEYNDADNEEKYFVQLGFSEQQKKAYRDAKREYFRYCKEHDYY